MPSSKYSRAHQALVVQRAAAMRVALTPSEQALGALLRGGQLGVWFRRQVPLGRFVADFVAPSARLVVEVDGGYHARRCMAGHRAAPDVSAGDVLATPRRGSMSVRCELVVGAVLAASWAGADPQVWTITGAQQRPAQPAAERDREC
jgi:hypothetical protein